jgi:hypothetical protein
MKSFLIRNTNVNALWNVASHSMVETDRRFRGTYCLLHRPDIRRSKHLCFYQTTISNIPEGDHPYTCRLENRKSHQDTMYVVMDTYFYSRSFSLRENDFSSSLSRLVCFSGPSSPVPKS